jgi:cytochrome c-type protein NapB
MTTPLYAVDALDELNMGLSKGSVFETPTPSASHYADIETGKSKRSSVAYSTLPPQVTHTFAEYLPITLDENECLDCHDRRKYLNRKDWQWKVGRKLPMPDDHYGSFEKQGGSEDVAGARYNCTQCHVQMSDAVPLVENTFKQ